MGFDFLMSVEVLPLSVGWPQLKMYRHEKMRKSELDSIHDICKAI
jgi:hypothetical protein